MIRCTLVLAACLGLPSNAAEDAVEREIAALIERTNALRTMHLVYDVRDSTGELGEGTLELVYRAPDLARIRMASGMGEFDFWVVGDEVFTLTTLAGKGAPADGEWHRGQYPSSRPLDVLYELFPAADTVLGGGVALVVGAADEEDGGVDVRFQVIRDSNRRLWILGWLGQLAARSSDVSVRDEALVLAGASYELSVSRTKGLLESLRFTNEEGRMELFDLREAHLDEELTPSVATLPAEARGAEIDEDLSASLRVLVPEPRRAGFLRVESLLDAGSISWDEAARDKWRTFLTELHEPALAKRTASWVASVRESIEKQASWVRVHPAKNDTGDARRELEAQVEAMRASLVESLDAGAANCAAALPEVESERFTPREELYVIELEVVSALWAELVADPLLEAFDDEVEGA